MPEFRSPHEPANEDLDRRIRDLVARAVADSPAPPDLDRPAVTVEPAAPDHGRRWLGGALALAAAAALVVVFVLTARVSDPGDDPPATEPDATVTDRTTPSTDADPLVSAAAARDTVLTAGADGVVEHVGTDRRVLTAEEMAIALDAGDGQVIVQRSTGEAAGDEAAATIPLVLAEGVLTELFGTANWGGEVELHDVEVVDGRRLLLFTRRTGDDDPGMLYAVDLDGDALARIEVGVLDGATGRLHLATSGLVIGEASDPTVGAPQLGVWSIPGSPARDAVLPTTVDLGLPAPPADGCGDCPRAFTVAPDGETFAWIDGDALVIHNGDGGYAHRFVLGGSIDGYVDLDIGGGRALLSRHDRGDPARSVAFSDPGAAPTTIGGHRATLAPGDVLPPLTLPSVVDDVVAAGPDGVVAYQDDTGTTVTDEAMEMALGIGDGRYLVQRRLPIEGTDDLTPADTRPLVVDGSGGLAPLWSRPPEGFVELHDIEIVDSRQLLLYTIASIAGDADVTTDLELGPRSAFVIDLAEPDAAPVELAAVEDADTVAVGRLHLTTDGLVVGERTTGNAVELLVIAVPGSVADDGEFPASDDLDLDLPDDARQCRACPSSFTVSPHGTNLAWLVSPVEGGSAELVMHSTADGRQRRFNPFPTAVDPAQLGELDVLAEGALLLSFLDPTGGRPSPPVYIGYDGRPTELTGTIATGDPTGSG